MRARVSFVAVFSLALALALTTGARTAEAAAPPLQLPWPTGDQHHISGGATYGCYKHNRLNASSSTAYNADYYAIDFQFGPIDGSPLDVSAVAAGHVIFKGWVDDYGNKVVLDHGGGYISVYAHFRATNTWAAGIEEGVWVGQGQPLGYAGDTGGDYAVHLHFHMQKNGTQAHVPEPMSGVSNFGQWGWCEGTTSPYWTSEAPHSGSLPACLDLEYTLDSNKWTTRYKWWFNSSSTPSEVIVANAEQKLREATQNITDANTDCPLPDNISFTASYQGRKQQSVQINTNATCQANGNGNSATGFGNLPAGHLTKTCTWYEDGVLTESDVRLNKDDYLWVANIGSNCTSKWSVEGVATRQRARTARLSLVDEDIHGNLTMSLRFNGPCQDSETTLGLGDISGLQQKY